MSRLVLLLAAVLAAMVLAGACASGPDKKDKKRARRYDGPIIDLHAHWDWSSPEGFATNAADARVYRVAALVHAAPGRLDETRAQNDAVIALAQQNPKVVVVGSVHPADGKAALDEIERLHQANVRAILLHTAWQGIALEDTRTNDVIAKAGALGVIVFVEAQLGDPLVVSKVLALAIRNPAARIVLSDAGLVDFAQLLALDVAKRDPKSGFQNNVWISLSSSAALYQDSPYAEQLAWVVQRLGDRVVFGSEFPVESSANAALTVGKLGLSEAEAGGVLYGNAARLLGL